MAKKLGTLKCKRLFLGVDAAGASTEVTASAAELNQLATGTVVASITGDVTGNVTGDLTGNVTGNVTGDLTGNATGDLTGNVTGNLTGDVTGNLTGDVTGNVTGIHFGATIVTPTGVLADTDLADGDFDTELIQLDSAAASVVVSNWTPVIGKTYILSCPDNSNTVSVTLSSGLTFDGANDIATFPNVNDTMMVAPVSLTLVAVLANVGPVAFTATT